MKATRFQDYKDEVYEIRLSRGDAPGRSLLVAFAVRRITDASARRSGPDIQFEESASDALIGLDLNG